MLQLEHACQTRFGNEVLLRSRRVLSDQVKAVIHRVDCARRLRLRPLSLVDIRCHVEVLLCEVSDSGRVQYAQAGCFKMLQMSDNLI